MSECPTNTLPYKRKVVIGSCTLYEGDCIEVMKTLGKVDAVVTDIPYSISQKSNGLRKLDYGEWDGPNATRIAFSALSALDHVDSIVAWCGWKQLSYIEKLFKNRSSRPLSWCKPNPPVLNGDKLFLSSSEFAYYGKLPKAWFGGYCVKSYWSGLPPIDRQHPTQKPLALMEWCILNTVAPSSICIDPFLGSGTTGVACAKLGRKFIGIEIDPDYFDIACERIAKAYEQPDLFVEQPETIKKIEQVELEI